MTRLPQLAVRRAVRLRHPVDGAIILSFVAVGLVRNVWLGVVVLINCTKVCASCCISCISKQVQSQPYGPWNHVPPHVWALVDDPSTALVDDCEGDEDVYALSCLKYTTTSCEQGSEVMGSA